MEKRAPMTAVRAQLALGSIVTPYAFTCGELQFVCVQPSVIAAACVATAVRGIFHQSKHSPSISSTLATYSQQLQIEIDSEYIEHYVNRIETLFAHRTAKLVAIEGSNSKVDDTKLITNSSSCSTSSTSSTSVNNIVISSSCSTASSDIKSTNEGSTESVSHYHPHTAAHHTHHNHRSHSHHQHHHHHHHHHHNSSARAHSHQSHPLMMSQQSGQQSSSYYASKHNHSTQMHSSLHSNNNKSNHNSVSSMGKGTIISVPASTTTTSTMSTINSRNRGNINTTSVPSSSDLFMFDESIHTVGSYSFAQVASAKQLLLESQSNRVPQSYRHCSTNRSYHIPNRENIPVFIMNVDNANATNTNVANSNTNDLELLTTSEELPDDDDDELL
ncbi:hypothetical protein BLOT_005931 [Blomia tropicalis]|nr:hypothetical protein BLOT_005931 [Blomia tropicalis]